MRRVELAAQGRAQIDLCIVRNDRDRHALIGVAVQHIGHEIRRCRPQIGNLCPRHRARDIQHQCDFHIGDRLHRARSGLGIELFNPDQMQKERVGCRPCRGLHIPAAQPVQHDNAFQLVREARLFHAILDHRLRIQPLGQPCGHQRAAVQRLGEMGAGGLIFENVNRHPANHRHQNEQEQEQGENDQRAVFGLGINAQCFGHEGSHETYPVVLLRVAPVAIRPCPRLGVVAKLWRNCGKCGGCQTGPGPVETIPSSPV